MKPKDFHLAAAVSLGLGALGVSYTGHWLLGVMLGLGAFAALLHWKAAKSGLIE